MYLNIWSPEELDDLPPNNQDNQQESRLSRYLQSLGDLLRLRSSSDADQHEDEE